MELPCGDDTRCGSRARTLRRRVSCGSSYGIVDAVWETEHVQRTASCAHALCTTMLDWVVALICALPRWMLKRRCRPPCGMPLKGRFFNAAAATHGPRQRARSSSSFSCLILRAENAGNPGDRALLPLPSRRQFTKDCFGTRMRSYKLGICRRKCRPLLGRILAVNRVSIEIAFPAAGRSSRRRGLALIMRGGITYFVCLSACSLGERRALPVNFVTACHRGWRRARELRGQLLPLC